MSLASVQQYVTTLSSVLRRYGVFIAATALLIFGVAFLIGGRGEISEAVGLLASISPSWLVVLAFLQGIVLLIAGWTFQLILRRQGFEVGLWRLIEIQLQRIVIGTVTPVGGPASLYVLVRALRKHNVSDSDALIVASIRSIGGAIAFVIFLIPVLLLQPPTTLVIIATISVFVSLAASLWCCVVVLRTGDVPDFVRRWAPQAVLTFIATAKSHRLTPVDFVVPTILGFFSHAVTAVMLFVGLQAVGFSASVSTMLIGYVVGKLFFMIAPVFQGIGVVEIGMVLALQQAGVPSAFAVSSALLYRVGDLWLPLSWGFLVQLVRMPLRQHLRDASVQAGEMVSGASRLARWPMSLYPRAIHLGRVALVTEAPLALMAGGVVVLAGGLPFTG